MEILVHVSAPTSRKDDDRFRELARAYEQFEPSRRIPIYPQPRANEGEALKWNDELPNKSTSAVAASLARPREDQAERQEQLAQSTAFFTPSSSLALPSTARVPQSTVPFPSSKNALQQLENIHHKWRKSLRSSGFGGTAAITSSARRKSNSSLPASSLFIEDTQLAAAALESQLPWLEDSCLSSEAPASPGAKKRRRSSEGSRCDTSSGDSQLSTEGPASRRAKKPRYDLEDLGPDDGTTLGSTGPNDTERSVPKTIVTKPFNNSHVDASVRSSSYIFNRGLYAVVPKPSIAVRAHTDEVRHTTAAERSPSPPPPGISLPKKELVPAPGPSAATNQPPCPVTHPPSAPTKPDLSLLPLEICPPPPNPSTSPTLPSQVTPTLQHIISLPALANKFSTCLESRSRELRPTERGHWLVDTKGWEAKLVSGFWDFLGKSIGEGGCGWGVWCAREEERDGDGDVSIENGLCRQETDGEKSKGLGVVRVYCWGEVVEHIWLLLYLASNRRIRRMGLGWVDVGGEVVVRMKMMSR